MLYILLYYVVNQICKRNFFVKTFEEFIVSIWLFIFFRKKKLSFRKETILIFDQKSYLQRKWK